MNPNAPRQRGWPIGARPRALAVALGALAAVGALAACGDPPPPKTAPLPTEEARADYGAYSHSLARVIEGALAGKAPPPHALCPGDGKDDVRATAASERQKFAALGPQPALVMVSVKVSLSAHGRAGLAPEDFNDVATATPHAFVHARSLVGPNGHTSWAEVTGYVAGMEAPQENRAKLTDLAAPLQSELSALTTGLRADGCTAKLLTGEELDALPYAMGKDERETILTEMKTVARGLPRACKAARSAEPPWEVHFHHVEAIFRGAGSLAKVRARLRVFGESPCLGPIDVTKVVRDAS
ncbi:MAG: hypothetical protein JNL38_25555 [Myxococcales bacterium]|jgi:hypothetical protein|nr:hypothetical protein [Myxococcales bacterium]